MRNKYSDGDCDCIRGTVIDKPWAIVYGPRYEKENGKGLMYGLGLTREDAWTNAVLVMMAGGNVSNIQSTIEGLKKRGMVARRVTVTVEEK